MKRYPSDQLAFSLLEPQLEKALSNIPREKLPTNITSNKHAIHRWFNFVAGFAPEFVMQSCENLVGGNLLDPFAGCGTALVVAQKLGLKSIGYEAHPFFARVARAKTTFPPDIDKLNRIEATLLRGVTSRLEAEPSLGIAAEAFLNKLFERETLCQLLRARLALEEEGLESDDLAFLLLSRVLDKCSKAKTDGIYKAPTSAKKAEQPNQAIKSTIAEIRHDIRIASPSCSLPVASIYESSSENMSEVAASSIDVTVTSPPYLNNFDFAEMTRMYLYFWGWCDSWKEISLKVRSKLLVNTTTALAGHRNNQEAHRSGIPGSLLEELDHIVFLLKQEKRTRAGKKDYDLLIYPYFSQTTAVLKENYRCLKPGCKTHWVVADAAFYGVHVRTPQLIAEAMSEIGYKEVKCVKLRTRGTRWILTKRDGSPNGLGEYHISAKREN